MSVCVRVPRKDGKERDLFETTDESGILVQRCGNCSQIHILMYKKRELGTIPSVAIDIDDTFAAQLVAKLLLLIAEAQPTAPSSDSTH